MMSIKGLSDVMKDALGSMSPGNFYRAVSLLSETKSNIREELQKITSKQIEEIIKKLEKKEPLTSEDIAYIKLWIVGDAQSYTKMENNFDDWVNEFKRLTEVLKKYEDRECSKEELSDLRGILEDAIRVASDIGNFLEKKERIKKFEEAVRDPNTMDTEIVIKILTEKLRSPLM